MVIATEAIVIATIKYGDTSLIAKCLTASDGVKTYMLKGVLASRKGKIKAAHFQPLTLLDIVADHRNKGNLNYIKEVKIHYPFKTVHSNPAKSAVVLFLSEILNNSLYEEEENQPMFRYIKEALQWLDAHDAIANFHILFLIDLTAYLGFYPNTKNNTYPFFDLQEGKYIANASLNPIVSGEQLIMLKAFLGTKFDAIHTVKMRKEVRQQLLGIILDYFRLHVHGFKKPKSLPVLNEIFK